MNPYHKIETLLVRDPENMSRVTEELKDPRVDSFKSWIPTQKLDGTNIRIQLPHETFQGCRTVYFGGRSDRAQLPPALVQHLEDTFRHKYPSRANEAKDAVRATFAESPDAPICLYGEGVGPGIQKNGGAYGDHPHFVLFDVKVGDGMTGWLDDDAVTGIAERLGIPRAPLYAHHSIWTLEELIAQTKIGWPDRHGNKPEAEGIVARPLGGPFYDRRGKRVIIKLKTKDFREPLH